MTLRLAIPGKRVALVRSHMDQTDSDETAGLLPVTAALQIAKSRSSCEKANPIPTIGVVPKKAAQEVVGNFARESLKIASANIKTI